MASALADTRCPDVFRKGSRVDVWKSAEGSMIISASGVRVSLNFPYYFALIYRCQRLISVIDARGRRVLAAEVIREGDKGLIRVDGGKATG